MNKYIFLLFFLTIMLGFTACGTVETESTQISAVEESGSAGENESNGEKVTNETSAETTALSVDESSVTEIPYNEVTIPSCVLFSYEDGVSISVEGGSFNANGNIASNGSADINAAANSINGTVAEHQSISMPYYHEIIESSYFWNDVNYMSDDYDPNHTVDIAAYSETDYINDSADFEINDTAVMAVNNINFSSDSFNGSNMILYSCFGNIDLTSGNVSGSGLIYAPLGTVTIKCDTMDFSGVIMAQNIKITGETGITLNKNEEFISSLESGKTSIAVPRGDDSDIMDIGEAYFKEVESLDDIIDAGDGLFCVKRQLLLTAEDDVDFEQIRELAESYNASVVGYIGLTNDYQIEFNYDIDIDELKGMIPIMSDIPYIQSVSLNIYIEEYIEGPAAPAVEDD